MHSVFYAKHKRSDSKVYVGLSPPKKPFFPFKGVHKIATGDSVL